MGNFPVCLSSEDDQNCFGWDMKKIRSKLGKDKILFFHSREPVQALSSPSQPLPPKDLLWGCNTPGEHYSLIETACGKTEGKGGRIIHGDESENEHGGVSALLNAMGFDFRMAHHPDKCVCGFLTNDDMNEYFESLDDDNDVNDYKESCIDFDQTSYLVPIGTPPSQEQSRVLDETEMREGFTTHIINEIPKEDTSTKDISSCGMISRSTSAVSLFSLATHYTNTSTDLATQEIKEEGCALRLYHVPSQTLVTPDNFKKVIAKGEMYDKVAALCMEYAQSIMMKQGNLRWVSIYGADGGVRALISKNFDVDSCSSGREGDGGTLLMKRKRKVLLVVTGKGLVRAGIFSRRHLMTMGVEAATAIPFISEAIKRDMEIVMLDPNAKGQQMSMDVVEASLKQLFPEQEIQEEDIYVLAHSMAGSHLVRLLNKNALFDNGSRENNRPPKINTAIPDKVTLTTKNAQSFQQNIKAIAFTDSNHNINWTKSNASLTDLLVGPSSLYIKSHKKHEDAKALGEPHRECKFWRHRFGAIRTLWAGTHEHSLTNYTAKFHIWNHFDSFLEQEKCLSVGGGGSDSSSEHVPFF